MSFFKPIPPNFTVNNAKTIMLRCFGYVFIIGIAKDLPR